MPYAAALFLFSSETAGPNRDTGHLVGEGDGMKVLRAIGTER